MCHWDLYSSHPLMHCLSLSGINYLLRYLAPHFPQLIEVIIRTAAKTAPAECLKIEPPNVLVFITPSPLDLSQISCKIRSLSRPLYRLVGVWFAYGLDIILRP